MIELATLVGVVRGRRRKLAAIYAATGVGGRSVPQSSRSRPTMAIASQGDADQFAHLVPVRSILRGRAPLEELQGPFAHLLRG